jgi:hemerythrin-like metal-binding protein
MNPECFVHYTTGHKVIDDEHYELLSVADEIIKLCKSKFIPVEEITTKMQHLNKLLLAHMQHEEDLMRNSNYPYFKAHCELHDELRIRFKKLLTINDFSYNRVEFLVDELQHIFINHIDAYDMQIKLGPVA